VTDDCDQPHPDDLPFRRSRLRLLWVVFLAIPVIQLAGTEPTASEVVLQVLGAGAFIAIAVRTMWRPISSVEGRQPALREALPTVVLMAVLVTLLATLGVSSWSVLYPSLVIFAVRLLPARWLLWATLAITVVAAAGSLAGGPWSAVSVGAATFGVGLLMSMVRITSDTNARLRAAQDELARLAVADERLRFARDMHDLVGHSLSVIALKAELAGRLTRDRPDEAARHVADIERVARSALGEVREVVSGYRRPLLDAEVAGARLALDAAGIDAVVDAHPLDLTPEAEAVLAWTVREGTTNVIRHSGAAHCTIAVTNGGARAAVEVRDDGPGAPGAADGNGLAGLRERAAEVDGEVDAGPAAGGGFRLRVSVPA
jgi:two-component system, NarL family, sensor histidine kinase DesK